jgi:hypothetical protein
MKKIFTLLMFFAVVLIHEATAGGGGGGGCTFSDAAGAGTSVSTGTTYTLDNTSCDATEACESPALSFCSSCDCTFDECYYYSMGATCSVASCFCGSPENSMYATFCPTTSGNYTFNIGSATCSGGGGSLQWGITATSGYSCANGYTMTCVSGTTGSSSVTHALTGGACYKLFFDGNAGAACTWTFSISSPLSLDLLHFNTVNNRNENIIKFELANIRDAKEIVVEKSTNGTNFTDLTYFSVTNNSKFEFKDRSISKVTYYRLKQKDKSGNIEYSEIKTCIADIKFELQNHTVFDRQLILNYISESEDVVDFKLLTINGEEVYKTLINSSIGKNRQLINLSGFKNGIYLFSMTDKNNNSVVKKIIINNN